MEGMLFNIQPPLAMGAPSLPAAIVPVSRTLPQWSKTAIHTLSDSPEDDLICPVKKSPPEQGGSGFIIGGDATARIAHLEHSVRFLQEQHRLMLSGLHTEIEALRERNRDLQFQLIFNKESSAKAAPPTPEESTENVEEVANLKKEVSRLEREANAARGEARAAEARALQLQRLVDAQAEKLRELELQVSPEASSAQAQALAARAAHEEGSEESRAELRARLAEAERLVRRLRGDAERQRRELQCMKNSLHASLRASGLDGYGYQNSYHFPPLHAPEFWREPLREEYSVSNPRGNAHGGHGHAGHGHAGHGHAAHGHAGHAARARRPVTLPELTGQQIHRSTVYANIYATEHARPRPNGYENGHKKKGNADPSYKSPDEPIGATPQGSETRGAGGGGGGGGGGRPRRAHHRKHAPDHT